MEVDNPEVFGILMALQGREQALSIAGIKRPCLWEGRYAIPTPLHWRVCLRQKERYGEHRAPRPSEVWVYGVQA